MGVFKPMPAVGKHPGILPKALRLRLKWSTLTLLNLFHPQLVAPHLDEALCERMGADCEATALLTGVGVEVQPHDTPNALGICGDSSPGLRA